MLTVQAYRTSDVFSDLRSEWDTLLTQAASNHVFVTWEWQSTWWDVYHPGDLWVLTVRNPEGQLVGIAPWFIQETHKMGRTVRSIGCVDVTDYLEIICHREYVVNVLTALSDYVVAQQSLFDTIDLCNIPQHSHVLTYLPELLTQRGLEVRVKQQEVCPIITLPESWEAYETMLDKKNRHELRRKIRRSEGVEENVRWYLVDESHDLAAEMAKFLRLMASASSEKAEFLQEPANALFFRRILEVMAKAGWLQMAFLLIGEQEAAAYVNFVYGDEVLVYNSGLDLSVSTGLSPGIVLLAHLIRHAIERGYRKFDFLRGDEEYKYRMGGRDTEVMMLTATVPSNRGVLVSLSDAETA